MLTLYYTCPKKKCRFTWDSLDMVALNDDCPQCGAKDISPVDIKHLDSEERGTK